MQIVVGLNVNKCVVGEEESRRKGGKRVRARARAREKVRGDTYKGVRRVVDTCIGCTLIVYVPIASAFVQVDSSPNALGCRVGAVAFGSISTINIGVGINSSVGSRNDWQAATKSLVVPVAIVAVVCEHLTWTDTPVHFGVVDSTSHAIVQCSCGGSGGTLGIVVAAVAAAVVVGAATPRNWCFASSPELFFRSHLDPPLHRFFEDDVDVESRALRF